MAEAALRDFPEAVVDASVLEKDPAQRFPGGRGWGPKVQHFTLAQKGAPLLVKQVFNLRMDHDIVGFSASVGTTAV